ncbi:hypothetical protein BGZ99_000252 [Dissophora globulifera]|uniref:site-specific DNA-methyltransferase (adenine-specific) n=1 Tax=Dissophora globulifera TaxID=979702 RepID=A0A9P6R5D8_9FUNG|nr:hypothetical protein BGZ99_000252 [Dissophora globulifera]
MAVGTLLGRLLIATKQHVRYMLDSYIHSDQRDIHPNLERVLIELLNGMLQSHGAFATRDNLSSQEQPMTFRPTAVRSLSHLRDLISATSVPSHLGTPLSSSSIPSASSKSPARSTQSEMPHLISSRQRSSPLPPSRLSESTLYPGTTDTDAEMYTNSGAGPHQPRPTAYDDQQAEVYNSTVEFLALMTAFVSVVCWLMQRMLDHPEGMRDLSGASRSKGNGDTGRDMDLDQDTNRRRWTSGNKLSDFLDLFNDRDNVLRPIGEALAGEGHREGREAAGEFEFDPTKQVGLFAWHFYLFGSDPEGPLIKDGGSISGHALRSLEFDVILNELYTTHILSMTVKEHQKDHGQFYTPPAVVDFMWKRTIKGYGNLLARFMDVVVTGAQGRPIPQQSHGQSTPLIPIALDPCLGVSTFLSCYIRMLIQEARTGHGGVIWDSAEATGLLLREICEHIWGIELDGFAFWMARCGVLAALIPLVQRVQELSQADQSATPHHSNQEYSPRTNLPSQTPFSLTLPRLHLFRNDTLQLLPPADLESPHAVWERDCILRLRNPARLIFDFIVTNPPYMIRKTGTFSAPDPEVYDWTILGSGFAPSTNANVGGMSTGGGGGSNTVPLLQVPKTKLVGKRSWDSLGDLAEEGNLSAVDTGEDSETDAATPESRASAASVASSFLRPTTPLRSGAKGMMQAYGYFIWFAAQRIKPYTGIACMITASQWLTLEFATKLRAWLFENCLMDEFFQFEPFKVFSKIQTDSLIFKIRALDNAPSYDPQRERLLQEHTTVFLRHTDHHRPLAGILQDYMEYSEMRSSSLTNDLSIMVSSKSRQELSAIIVAPSPASTPSISGLAISGNAITKTTPTPTPTTFTARTYSFAPMMPSSDLTTHLLTLTQGLGGICSAGTKKMNRLNAAEPLLWHRGPNTNPVYGLVVRMEYARATFGEVMTERWFRPTMYWNGKNYPEENAPGAALHKEGMFWQGRDRLRLSKKEGSPAESYLVPIPDPQRSYALCMVDKESIKLLRQQMQENVAGAQALWSYLTDVKTHFQPGLLATLKRKVNLSGKQQGADNEGVAYCSTNQCGSDVPEKIVHPINYGYFSKTQPRQRFFLDTDSQAVTNQCIYLTLNVLSRHYDAQHSASLIYFLTLLNSSTLQFFVLHFCQYDQQGRMRLFRESMAKIPFQSKDVKNNQERTQYASQLGEMMMELKKLLYQAVTNWRLTGSHYHQLDQRQGGGGGGWQGSTGTSSRGSHTGGSGGRGYGNHRPGDPLLADGIAAPPAPSSGGGNHGLLDWIRRGGDAPAGVLVKTKEQIRRMLMMAGVTPTPPLPHHTPSMSQSPSPLSLVHAKRSDALMADADADANPGTDSDSEIEDTVKARAQEPYFTVNHQSAEHPLNWTEHPRIYGSTSGRFSSEVTATDRFIPASTFGTNTPAPTDHRQQIHQHGDMDPRRHQAPQPFQNQFHPLSSVSDDGRVALVETHYLSPDSAAPYRSPLVASPAPPETRPTSATPPPPPSSSSSSSSLPSTAYFLNYTTVNSELSNECDRIMQSIERAIAMVEMVQWAVDQYGYMLYGIRPKFQKLLELELKLVYGSVVESVVVPRSPVVGAVSIARLPGPEAAFSSMSSSATSPFGEGSGAGSGAGLQQPHQQKVMTDTAASRIGINILELHRWDGDGDDGDEGSDFVDASGTTSTTSSSTPATGTVMGAVSGDSQQQHASTSPRHPSKIPSYATLILENALTAAENLKQSLQRYKPFSGIA